MAFITYPLNNIDYTAEDAELFHCTRTSGIWAEDSFPISVTGADNNITIGKGIAWINNEEFSGKVTALKSAKVLDLGIADSIYPRIDVIAIQFNANNNATDVIVKNGTPATNPVRPAIVRTGAIYELYLASIYRPVAATAITASNITDLRMDETVCGLMADSVTKVDMTAIEAQVRAFINNLQSEIDSIRDLSGLMFESEWTEGGVIPVSKGGTGVDNAANVLTNLGVANHILEEYDEDDWHIVKYSNGYARVTYRGNIGQVTCNTAIAAGMVSAGIRYTFPITFTEIPYCDVRYEGNATGYAELQIVGGSDNATSETRSYAVRLWRYGTSSSVLQNNIFGVEAYGKYK